MNKVKRPYTQEDVEKLRGSIKVEYTLARLGAKRFRRQLESGIEPIRALGAVTGNQAMQQVKAGLQAIYCSGWQVAADANIEGHMYPDQSLYSVSSVPKLVKKINQTLQRADQIESVEDAGVQRDWFAPIIADAEAGFGGPLNAFELMKSMIEAGVAAVHFEDQLSSAKKCGHLGGKVLVPASEFIRKLVAARLAADVLGVSTLIIARTDANSARLLTTDIDASDYDFITNKHSRTSVSGDEHVWHDRTPEGFYHITGGLDMAINRGLQYAPYADLLWCETSKPNLDEARQFAEAIHAQFPGKWLAYNCSPSFNWGDNMTHKEACAFQRELGKLGYKFQFVTLAGFHALNHSMFTLAENYKYDGMGAYLNFQHGEFVSAPSGFTAHKHQREVGTGYFDAVAQTITSNTSTLAMEESTESDQF